MPNIVRRVPRDTIIAIVDSPGVKKAVTDTGVATPINPTRYMVGDADAVVTITSANMGEGVFLGD